MAWHFVILWHFVFIFSLSMFCPALLILFIGHFPTSNEKNIKNEKVTKNYDYNLNQQQHQQPFCEESLDCVDKIRRMARETNRFWFGDQWTMNCGGWHLQQKRRERNARGVGKKRKDGQEGDGMPKGKKGGGEGNLGRWMRKGTKVCTCQQQQKDN